MAPKKGYQIGRVPPSEQPAQFRGRPISRAQQAVRAPPASTTRRQFVSGPPAARAISTRPTSAAAIRGTSQTRRAVPQAIPRRDQSINRPVGVRAQSRIRDVNQGATVRPQSRRGSISAVGSTVGYARNTVSSQGHQSNTYINNGGGRSTKPVVASNHVPGASKSSSISDCRQQVRGLGAVPSKYPAGSEASRPNRANLGPPPTRYAKARYEDVPYQSRNAGYSFSSGTGPGRGEKGKERAVDPPINDEAGSSSRVQPRSRRQSFSDQPSDQTRTPGVPRERPNFDGGQAIQALQGLSLSRRNSVQDLRALPRAHEEREGRTAARLPQRRGESRRARRESSTRLPVEAEEEREGRGATREIQQETGTSRPRRGSSARVPVNYYEYGQRYISPVLGPSATSLFADLGRGSPDGRRGIDYFATAERLEREAAWTTPMPSRRPSPEPQAYPPTAQRPRHRPSSRRPSMVGTTGTGTLASTPTGMSTGPSVPRLGPPAITGGPSTAVAGPSIAQAGPSQPGTQSFERFERVRPGQDEGVRDYLNRMVNTYGDRINPHMRRRMRRMAEEEGHMRRWLDEEVGLSEARKRCERLWGRYVALGNLENVRKSGQSG